jgi:hypothetical protein
VTTGPHLDGGVETTVELKRIRKIQTIQIMRSDLEHLQAAYGDELTALGFWTALMAAAVSVGATYQLTENTTPKQDAVYVPLLAFLVVGTLWFMAAWMRKRSNRKIILTRVLNPDGVTQSEHTSTVPAASFESTDRND